MTPPVFGQPLPKSGPISTRDATHAYAARAECGCVEAITVDTSDARTAKAVGEFIRDGLAVERVTIEYARENFGHRCHKVGFCMCKACIARGEERMQGLQDSYDRSDP
jgi:hypothetical protein